MDFKLSEEEKLVRQAAAQFVSKELIPREGAYLKHEELFLPPGDPPRRSLDAETKATLTRLARHAGFLTLVSNSPNGVVVTNVARVLIYREFGRTILPFEPAFIPGAMVKSSHLQSLLEGQSTVALAFDQVHKTGTLSSVETWFRPEAAGYSLSNTTMDVFEPGADFYLLPAKEQGTGRVCLFLLSRAIPGLAIGEQEDLTTDATVGKLTLSGCKLPLDAMIGYEYETAAIVAAEQLRIAARCLGIGMRCLADSIEHARNRVTFGRPLASRQAIQWMLADLSMSLRTCTWLTLEAAWHADQEQPYFTAAALAKKRAAKMGFEAADTAIQIHGGYGVCKEFPFDGFYRETRLLRLFYGREADLNRTFGEKFVQEARQS